MNPPEAQLGFGEVWHARLRPRPHTFRYRSCFLMLPMRRLRETPCAALRRNARGWFSFHDADHGFATDDRGSYNAQAAKEAWGLTREFLRVNLGA